jgi:hypothetical protein
MPSAAPSPSAATAPSIAPLDLVAAGTESFILDGATEVDMDVLYNQPCNVLSAIAPQLHCIGEGHGDWQAIGCVPVLERTVEHTHKP